MSLRHFRLNASVAVSDMARAREFYEEQLGLVAERAGADNSRVYECGGDTALHVYPSPSHAGKSTATLATWYVEDVERVVDELISNGVTFEHYEGLTTDAKGISPRAGGGKVAWFKDPDGNTFAIEGDR
jgi:catechol 2,3-dioxygenase-like lactoylglutathione lyase family enzyme